MAQFCQHSCVWSWGEWGTGGGGWWGGGAIGMGSIHRSTCHTFVVAIHFLTNCSEDWCQTCYTPISMKLKRGTLVHLVRPSVCLSICERSRVRSVSNTRRIHFTFTHRINQLQNVCRMLSFFQNSKILIFVEFVYFIRVVRSSIWPLPFFIMMTLTYDHTHHQDLGLCIFFTKPEVSQTTL